MARDDGDGASETYAPRRMLGGQISGRLLSFVRTESGSAGLLLVCVLVALAWANTGWSSAYEALWSTTVSVQVGSSDLTMDLGHWVNDGLMRSEERRVGKQCRG